ncbi:head-to-tail connector protein FII [Rhodobacter phage RcSimone-Hastad]|jgi:hypothetical protein|nr:head-to-tail connector protein FII [Rhodobacter phage RcSimone-Hastad]
MTEYSSAIALAKRLITKKGRKNVSAYRPGASAPQDPARPWKLDGAPVADQLLASGMNVVFLDIRSSIGFLGQFGFEVSFRSRVENPDSLMPGSTAVAYIIPEQLGAARLQPEDLLLAGSTRYTVMRCDALQPGDELIMFVAQLKE